MHTVIIGSGISGLTAAWQLHQLGQSFTLYEATTRLGGTIRTVRRDGFTIDLGPDGWVTEKPWAAELARELGLADELIHSLDATRVTWILRDGKLLPIPDGMRLMVPSGLEALAALERSPVITPAALAAYRAEPARAAELKAHALATGQPDESVAAFVLRHFGNDVLNTLAAPLLAGVFGGNVWQLSVRAVMPQFVQMEHEHGSLILALQARKAQRANQPQPGIFTTLRTGTQTLIDRLAAALPPESIHLNCPIESVLSDGGAWLVQTPYAAWSLHDCDRIILATPTHITRNLLSGIAPPRVVELLPTESTSAILVALAFEQSFNLPPGFGFLVPFGEPSQLLAATFTDQKFPNRVPPNCRLVRAFFGGPSALALTSQDDATLSVLALTELEKILGPLPRPSLSLVQRWPLSLPQYAVGHQARIAELLSLLPHNLHLLGNPYHGVGLPDLIRDSRTLARSLA